VVGYIKLHRGWRDSPIFKGEFSRADAWVWLIEHACWKPSRVRIKGSFVQIERGEMTFSVRFLADAWGWSKSRVDRFLADLRAESMIETRSKIGTTAGHNAGQGQAIISICNYAKYQDAATPHRDNGDEEIGTTAGQQRDKEEEGKEKKEDNKGGAYAFDGKVIRLREDDLSRWQRAYPSLDILALLQSRDDWLSGQPADSQRRWFQSTSSWLAGKQQAERAHGGIKIGI